MKEIQKNRSQYSNNKQKNSSLKTIQIQNGSTKATSSLLGNGFLSQEFIVSKDKNQRKKVQNQKISKKQNLFDLERTLDINIEILKNYFKNTTTAMTLLNGSFLWCIVKSIILSTSHSHANILRR